MKSCIADKYDRGSANVNEYDASVRIVCGVTVLLLLCASASAQNRYLQLQGYPQHGYIEIPTDALLDTPQMTIEAWVSVRDPRAGACSSIAGSGYQTGWWLGLCGTSMSSYFNGTVSLKTGGIIPDAPGVWTHISAVPDEVERSQYINAVDVVEGAEDGEQVATTNNIGIGRDADWHFVAPAEI